MYTQKIFKYTSCLSPDVEKLFRNSVTNVSEPCLLPSPKPDGARLLLDWRLIHGLTVGPKSLNGRSPAQTQNYGSSIERLAPFLNYVMNVYGGFSEEEFSLQSKWMKWTHCENVFTHCWKLLVQKDDDCDIVLATLLLTAHLEHALGNVYLIKGKNVPFLMKDLLATEELLDIVGPEPIQVLKLLMGTPAALNLRNVLWHGFMSPSEIDARYGYFLIAAAISLGVHLQTKYDEIPKRKLYNFESSKVLTNFPDLVNSDILKRIFEAASILPQMRQYLYYTSNLYEQKRYGECTALLLPSLECILRCLFAAANECPERILTAESDTFYTTFDEILSQTLPNSKENILLRSLHGHLFEMLLDVLNYQQGPRIRDRMSHGEVQLDIIPKELSSHLLHLSACICLQLSDLPLQDAYVVSIRNAALNYKAHFHPTSLLFAKVKQLLTELLQWEHLPQTLNESKQTSMKVENLKSFEDLLNGIGVNEERSLKSYFILLDEMQACLESLTVCTLFRPRQELETVSALQQATANLLQASVNIRSSLEDKHVKFVNRQLRSRQRANYQKLLNNCDDMFEGLVYLSLTLLYFSSNINRIGKLNVKDYHQYLKFFKKTIQYSENLVVLSASENNDWDKILELHKQFLTLSSNFNSRFPFGTVFS